MFVNGSGALRQIGSGMKAKGAGALSKAASATGKVAPAKSGLESLSSRKRKKLIDDAVNAHERLSAIDNANYTHEVKTRAEGGLLLSAAGHDYVETSDSRGGSLKMRRKGEYQGPNPYQQDGYYSPHTAHTDMASGANQPARNQTTTAAPAGAIGASRPTLALPAGSATVYDKQAGQRPGTTAVPTTGKPFVGNAKGEVVKPGAKPLNLKTPDSEERTFIGTKSGRYTREQGKNTAKKIENPKLVTPYEAVSAAQAADDIKKKRTRKKKDN
jgi:hypothetical protein